MFALEEERVGMPACNDLNGDRRAGGVLFLVFVFFFLRIR